MNFLGPRLLLGSRSRLRMLSDPDKYFIILAAGQDRLTHRVGIQSSKRQEASIQRRPRAEEIGGIRLRESPSRMEPDFIDQAR